MTEEAQRIAIAEACGWTEISDWGAGGINGKHPTGPWVEVIPDYLNDLNAIHEAEKMLKGGMRSKYDAELTLICLRDYNFIWESTAAQRAEAFRKTLDIPKP